MTWDIVLAIFIGSLACWLCGWLARGPRRSPTGICKWCGVLLYTPVGDHADICPEFRLMCHRAMVRAIAEFEKTEKGSVQ